MSKKKCCEKWKKKGKGCKKCPILGKLREDRKVE